MRILILCITLLFTLNASILDFNVLNNAEREYRQNNYIKAASLYSNINKEESIYNTANSLYKQKKYTEAIKQYNKINKKSLLFNKEYNTGNSFFNLKKYKEAKNKYEEALKIKFDKDAKYNLDIVNKILDKKKQNKDQKNKSDKDKKKQNKDQKNKPDKDKKKQSKYMTDFEERKLEKRLNSKRINTLMLPISNSRIDNVQNKW